MEGKKGVESALANLIQLSFEKGFLVFDDIYDEADKLALSIRDIDYLSNSIVAREILVYDEVPVTNVDGSLSEDVYVDYAHRDYEAIFNRVNELAPELENFVNSVRSVVPPQVHEMEQLKYQVREGNLYARERVVQMHLRFVVRIALQRAEIYDCEIADTLQDGCIGLLMAVDRYDPDSSGAFGPYASLWILQNISRTQVTQRPVVYYPVYKKEDYFAMYPFLKENGYLDSDIWKASDIRRQIQEQCGCSVDQVEDIINQSMPIESLDAIYEMYLENIEKDEIYDDVFEINVENEMQGNDFRNINLDSLYWNDNVYKEIEQRGLRETLENLMEELTDREREVLRMRYGFEDGDEKTLEEVGQMFGVTRERIRQIESKAIKKLSYPTRIRKLEDFL
jgi:RNA polymerase primary sigma factor